MRAATRLIPTALAKRLAALLHVESIERLALRGSLWSIGSYLFTQGVRLGSHLILARLLYPEAFGVVAIIWIIVTGFRNLSDFGAAHNIIQNKRDDTAFLNTVWTFQTMRGLIAWLVLWLAAGHIAQFYHEPLIRELLPIAGLSLVIDGLTSTKLYTSNRQLMLGGLARLEIVEQVLSSVLMVAWVAWQPSLYALVIAPIAARFAGMLCGHALLPGPINRLHWDSAAYRDMMHFGKWMFGVTMFTYLAAGTDQLILPRLIDAERFGLYAIASSFAALPMIIGARLTNQVLLPAVSQYRREQPTQALRWKIIDARRLFLALGLIMTLCLYLFSVPFFTLLYDVRYAAAGVMAQMLSLFIWATFLENSADRILLALGDSRATAVVLGTQVALMIVLALTGLHLMGLVGFIAGLAGGTLIAALLAHFFLRSSHLAMPLDDVVFSAGLGLCVLIAELWAHPAISFVAGIALNVLLVSIAAVAVIGGMRLVAHIEHTRREY